MSLQTLLHEQAAPLTRLVLRLEGLSCDLNLLRELQQQMGASWGEPSAMAGSQTVALEEICKTSSS